MTRFTGHSHRPWPDAAAEGQARALALAYELGDEKWPVIFNEVVPEFQRAVASRIGVADPSCITVGQNTHELGTRLLSCFRWNADMHVVTTESEFHSLTRQLARLEEEGVRITYVRTGERETLAQRLIEAITPDTDVVAFSTTFFSDGYVVPGVPDVVEAARAQRAVTLLDVYHHFNIRTFEADPLGPDVFVTAGGYKYGQGGEAAAWMKVPDDTELRPAITGWFADFGSLDVHPYPRPVCYGEGAYRFAGATFDPTSICRQIAVFKMMDENGWTVPALQRNSAYQTGYLADALRDIAGTRASVLSSSDDDRRGPFAALDTDSSERAESLKQDLRRNGILVDRRGSIIRLGPHETTTGVEIDLLLSELDSLL